MHIRTYVFLVGAAVLLPAFLAAGIGVDRVREGQREAALRGLQETVRATALLVDGEVQRSVGAMTALGNSEHLRTGDFRAFYEQAKAIDLPPSVWTLLLDETGTQILNTAVPFGTSPPPPSAKERVAQVLSTQSLLATDISKGPVTGKLVTTLYVPTKASPPGRRLVLAQAFAVNHWHQHLLSPASRPNWITAVVDKQGRFIWRSHQTARLVGELAPPELVAAAASQSGGLLRHKTREGIDSYDAFARSTLTGWTVEVAAPVETLHATVWAAVSWLVLGVAAALGLAVLAAALLGGFLVRAIARTSSAAQQLGEGALPELPLTSVDELDTLNASLMEASRKLASGTSALNAAVADREALLARESAAREEAVQQNSAKDKFIALLGHELRNPLAAITGATQVLVRTQTRDDERGTRMLQIIDRQNAHLRRIVDDLLDISRMMSGRLALQLVRFDFASGVRECVNSLRSSEGYPGRVLGLDAQEIWIRGDPVRMEQVVSNLVTNAMKFSKPGGEVRVVVRPEGPNALLKVVDKGAGIEADFLPHVFEPFTQGKPQEGQLAAGLGIGLALVKQLVELHGGNVDVRSTGPGEGATFVVLLPSCAPGREQGVIATRDLPLGMRALLIEDNPDALESTSELLRTLGLHVVTAQTGDEGIAKAKTVAPDVVIVDIGLPDRSGYEVVRDLRTISHLGAVPIVALTGYGQDADKQRAYEAGFTAHLTKPVDVGDLTRLLQKHLTAG